jgi:hypothetical protein
MAFAPDERLAPDCQNRRKMRVLGMKIDVLGQAGFRRTGRHTWAVSEASSLQSGAVCAFV